MPLFTTPQFIRPRYGQGCFADLPALIQHCLTGQTLPAGYGADWGEYLGRYEVVIAILVDAFGWQFFQRAAERIPVLRRLIQEGKTLRWTSQFPSTTAAHITCAQTGLPPGQSGIHEWQYYEPAVDAMISPLLFSFYGTNQRETLRGTGITPDQIYPAHTIYQQLEAQGVESYIYQPNEFFPSTYCDWLQRGAKTLRYQTLPEGFVNLRQQLARSKRPAYFHLYFGRIDSIGHHYGPDSPQFEAEIDAFCFAFERAFMQPLQGKLQDTLLILTADHGMDAVNPHSTIYLNTEPRFAGIERFLRRNRRGDLLVPAGSARDLFLYIEADRLAEAQAFLADRLEGVAEVAFTDQLIEQGYFGPPPVATRFLERVGNLVILPYAGESIWWYEKSRFEMSFWGHHGGLTRQEMEIPVCLYRFG